MQHIDTLICCRWIIPIEPHNVYLEHHAVAIQQGKIIDLLPNEIAEQRYSAQKKLTLSQHALLPGLINCHTHSPMTLLRGFADDRALMDWLENYIWPAEKKWMNDEFCYDGTRLAILEMVRGGTTCFNENYFYPQAIAKAVHDMKVRAAIGSTIIDFALHYAKTAADYVKVTEELYQSWHRHPLITVAIAPQGPYSVSDETFAKIRAFTEKYPIKIHLHLHETDDEIQHSLRHYQQRPIQRIAKLGLLSEQTQCIHMTQITPEDIKRLQQTGAHIVHCPQSNLKLASGFSPIKQFMHANLNIGIGTDGAASNNDLDLFNEVQTAALLAKAVAKDPTTLNAAEALRMATLNGAKVMGLDHQIGSIEKNKMADLIAVDLSTSNTQPIYNPISNLVYAAQQRQVSHVWIAGNLLLENTHFTLWNENEIISKSIEWQNKIAHHLQPV